MSAAKDAVKGPGRPSSPLSKDERLAKALRDNLARRKALQRAKRSRNEDEPAATATPSRSQSPAREDDAPS